MNTEPRSPNYEGILERIVDNYWWSFERRVGELVKDLNPAVWAKTASPYAVWVRSSPEKRRTFCDEHKAELLALDELLNLELSRHPAGGLRPKVAYFCMEYGLDKTFANYSGGLGILAGDHVKSASNLGHEMVFVGLLYSQGYFKQVIDQKGEQHDVYENIAWDEVPLKLACHDGEERVTVTVPLGDIEIEAQLWELRVGKSRLIFLDTNTESNSEEIRSLTDRLYSGDREKRLKQEIVLGIGGVRALSALGIDATVYHMNEGHSALLQLERVRQFLDKGLNIRAACDRAAASGVFTTHTPVPAGNEVFELALIDKLLRPYCVRYGISFADFMNLGITDELSDHKAFCLTVFALRLSRFHNGVSKLHGEIASRMWSSLWPGVPFGENPITAITNGVHAKTWTSGAFQALFARAIGENWPEIIAHAPDQIVDIPESMLEDTKQICKHQLLQALTPFLPEGKHLPSWDPRGLIIGFARRFATYKRATLLFRDIERLEKIVNQSDRPVYFVFAGKAHPQDLGGQDFIREICAVAERPGLKGKILVLENYDMNLSKLLVQGVDVWLNNPRRPFEASGTSGQKVAMNAGINFSVLDGWWCEGFHGDNGWAIGVERDFKSEAEQDEEDSRSFYRVLEDEVVNEYYANHSAFWARAKASLVSSIYQFSSDRMVQEYAEKMYLPCQNYINTWYKDSSVEQNRRADYRHELLKEWDLAKFSSVTGTSLTAAKSRYAEFTEAPLHALDFSPDDSSPGQVFDVTPGEITVDFYHDGFNISEFAVEMLGYAPKADPVHFALKPTTNLSKGLTRFQLKFDFKGRVRLRAFPRFGGEAHRLCYGHVLWF